MPGLVDGLAERWPIDRERVLVVEHLAIVKLALPDVFAWFDGVLR